MVDPTRNVLDLVAAAISRQDDLRNMSDRNQEKMAQLRADHAKELRTLEADRIDAIRAVDVTASQQGSKDAETRATALAAQVLASAEAMRNQVAAAATAAATSLAAALVPIQDAIADLRRAQYETQGQKAQVVESHGQTANTGVLVSGGLGVLVLVVAMIAIVIGLRHTSSTPVVTVPTVITVPVTTTP